MADPVAMVQRIYRHFELDYSKEFERRMQAYLGSNKQGKHGRHSYTLEEYGFEPDEVYRAHKEYMDHYGFLPQSSKSGTTAAATSTRG